MQQQLSSSETEIIKLFQSVHPKPMCQKKAGLFVLQMTQDAVHLDPQSLCPVSCEQFGRAYRRPSWRAPDTCRRDMTWAGSRHFSTQRLAAATSPTCQTHFLRSDPAPVWHGGSARVAGKGFRGFLKSSAPCKGSTGIESSCDKKFDLL